MRSTGPTIGVLSLQGCVHPHRPHIESLGILFKEVKTAEDMEQIDGLILPGGESTTMLKLIAIFNLSQGLEATFKRVPVWGICAGAILIAQEVHSPRQRSFGLMQIEIERNSYGRQLESFHTEVEKYPVSFIRAPKILSVGKGVTVLASREKSPIWVEQGRVMATTFHPELTSEYPSPMHRRFGEMVSAALSVS